MLRLTRGECPQELTDDVKRELTRLYAENKDRDVWNSPKIKKPLKTALLEMSHGKCSYCECLLGIESKDVTIDHFLPKSKHPDQVVEWENLFPACLRCNREKKNCQERIVNPCVDEPAQFVALDKTNTFRFKGIDAEGIGKATIRTIKLNDIERLIVPRQAEWEDIKQRLEYLYSNLQIAYHKRHRDYLRVLMKKCTSANSYSAIKATHMLHDDTYLKIKSILMENEAWTEEFENMETEMKKIGLQFS